MFNDRSVRSWLQDLHPFLRGWIGTMLTFVMLGTVSAVWANPFFVRMTPVGAWEFPALVLLALLSGAFVALPNACGLRRASVGGAAGFFGIACPTCNKILMLIFGGEALMLWFDPMRPFIAIGGIALLSVAIWRRWRRWRSFHNFQTNLQNEARHGDSRRHTLDAV